MYDKVKMIVPRTRDTPDIERYLSKGVQHTDLETGEIFTFGILAGLKVSIFPSSFHIVGSLTRLLYENNIYPLDRHSTKEAIEKLSDSLHLDMTQARVTGLEFGTQFVMKQPVEDYFPLLGEMPRLIRLHMNGSLYYKPRGKAQMKEFVFYDKKADGKAKGMVLPIGLENANLLKFEMRLKSRLSQQLNMAEVTASTLYDPVFYQLVMKRYQESYFSINKTKRLKTSYMEEIKTVKDAYNILFARLISQTEPKEINDFLEELKREKVFTDRKNYTRLKNKIQEMIDIGCTAADDDLLKELDDEIKNVGSYV